MAENNVANIQEAPQDIDVDAIAEAPQGEHVLDEPYAALTRILKGHKGPIIKILNYHKEVTEIEQALLEGQQQCVVLNNNVHARLNNPVYRGNGQFYQTFGLKVCTAVGEQGARFPTITTVTTKVGNCSRCYQIGKLGHLCRDISCIFGTYSNFTVRGTCIDVEDLRSAIYPNAPTDAAEYIKISPEEFIEGMDENPMTDCYELNIEHFLHLYVTMKGMPKYEEILCLRRIVDMEETAIMNIIFSFVHGMAIDDQTYIDRLTGNTMMRTN